MPICSECNVEHPCMECSKAQLKKISSLRRCNFCLNQEEAPSATETNVAPTATNQSLMVMLLIDEVLPVLYQRGIPPLMTDHPHNQHQHLEQQRLLLDNGQQQSQSPNQQYQYQYQQRQHYKSQQRQQAPVLQQQQQKNNVYYDPHDASVLRRRLKEVFHQDSMLWLAIPFLEGLLYAGDMMNRCVFIYTWQQRRTLSFVALFVSIQITQETIPIQGWQ